MIVEPVVTSHSNIMSDFPKLSDQFCSQIVFTWNIECIQVYLYMKIPHFEINNYRVKFYQVLIFPLNLQNLKIYLLLFTVNIL